MGIAGAVIAVVLEGRGELERAEWAWRVTPGAGALFVWSWGSARGLPCRDR